MTAEIETGVVKGTAVKANRDGGASVRMLDLELTSPEDVQSTQLVRLGGVDCHPVDGDKVIVFQVGTAWKLGVLLDDGIAPASAAGELWIYSRETDGTLSATIKLKNNGTVEILGADDYAVAYNDMKGAFDKLREDFNAVVTLLLTHTHTGVTTGGGTSGTSAAAFQQSTADMSSAKVTAVRLP